MLPTNSPTMIITEENSHRSSPSGQLLFYNAFKKHFKTYVSIEISPLLDNYIIENKGKANISPIEIIDTPLEFTILKKTKTQKTTLTSTQLNDILDTILKRIKQYIHNNFTIVDEFKSVNYIYSGVKSSDIHLLTSNEILLTITVYASTSLSLRIFAAQDIDVLHCIDFMRRFENRNTVDNNNINIVKNTQGGFSFFQRSLKDYSTKFSIDHYNDDFNPVSHKIISTINDVNNNKGLVLLHGGVGTGKTSYIKHLLNVSNRKVFYIPPDMAQSLSDPNFVEFVATTMSDSILVIEDAETILKPRGAGENQAVSNILNISDGILSDAISSIIICTFNDRIENIDQALLRPGRLIASYEFKSLETIKANQLLQKLYGDKYNTNQPMTLAEIFNRESMPMINAVKKQKVGFV